MSVPVLTCRQSQNVNAAAQLMWEHDCGAIPVIDDAGRLSGMINAGMSAEGDEPELTYIQTGLMAAILLGTKACDLIVGGCGTGQGFLNSAMQYP